MVKRLITNMPNLVIFPMLCVKRFQVPIFTCAFGMRWGHLHGCGPRYCLSTPLMTQAHSARKTSTSWVGYKVPPTELGR